jgi:superoxide dismutase
LHNTLVPECEEETRTSPMSEHGFINKHYGDYDNMKDQFETEAMKIQGSGWIVFV